MEKTYKHNTVLSRLIQLYFRKTAYRARLRIERSGFEPAWADLGGGPRGPPPFSLGFILKTIVINRLSINVVQSSPR